ncbi:MAG TPA: M20/M25/M40 family metallo-hydrolase [Candidatus Binataceae bacterium]|nr:M20/M25/M40 family metallo-hydrolase [Candidatus Binataceae bacterium]
MNDQTLAWCRRLIGCRSVTHEGTRTIAELCARELLAPAGIEARLIPSKDEGETQVNLLAMIPGADPAAAPLMLNTHLDTVPPGNPELWTECGGDPFAAIIKADRVYGLGAADTKLDFVAKVMALIGAKPRRQTWLVATFGEEHGLVGAKELATAGLLPRGALAFVGEPSRLEVVTAHKGLMVFELRVGFRPDSPPRSAAKMQRLLFAGRAAHSSTPALGRNAILLALDALAVRPELSVASISGGDAVNKVPARCEVLLQGAAPGGIPDTQTIAIDESLSALLPHAALATLASFAAALQQFADQAGPPEPDYASPTLTCNPGVIRSTSNSLTLDFELRPPPSLDLDRVREGVARIVTRLRDDAPGLELDLRERRANPGFRGALDSETVELALGALARAGLPLRTTVKAGCTEAGIYAAAGLKPVVFGPGPSTGVIHAPNEYNFLADVEGAIKFYRELLRS